MVFFRSLCMCGVKCHCLCFSWKLVKCCFSDFSEVKCYFFSRSCQATISLRALY